MTEMFFYTALLLTYETYETYKCTPRGAHSSQHSQNEVEYTSLTGFSWHYRAQTVFYGIRNRDEFDENARLWHVCSWDEREVKAMWVDHVGSHQSCCVNVLRTPLLSTGDGSFFALDRAQYCKEHQWTLSRWFVWPRNIIISRRSSSLVTVAGLIQSSNIFHRI